MPGARLVRMDISAIPANLPDTLDRHGHALIPGLLDAATCQVLAARYDEDALYRSRIVMKRHGFGSGEYRYYAYPLPEPVAALRRALYPLLAPIANRWNAQLRLDTRYPDTHAEYLRGCHDAGQQSPTPLILRYGPGDYNCLHQDLYGDWVFPLQVAILLSQPGRDFDGGEFMLTEQIAGQPARAEVVPLNQGDGVAFAVRHRPVPGARGSRRALMRHGVSRLHSGNRHTLGIIFHDAR
ncbi:Uncharacterized protein conserved in bacteria (DUF2086) [Bordetella ansorpii]|uniref:Uncharacterized protein conserved in bacteria (DUF2086) n=2 Tax=Bordetella ansorpii TaxID=288768 RepID=A0A157S6U1_9BORD|nr:Uncharacterized protein conserved in bacteria (DUF2086) [Bordetella ansorpii]